MSQSNAVSRAETTAENQHICVLEVVFGEPWGDGEAYAVATARRDSNSMGNDEWFGLVLVVIPCHF